MKCIMLSNNNFDEDFARHKLVNIIKPNMKVVCIPFGSDLKWLSKEARNELTYDGNFTKEQYRPFREYGIEQGNFYMLNPIEEIKFIKWKIDQADIIYFTGGKMENIKMTLAITGLWNYLLKYKDEKIFMGASAGALILQDEYIEVPYIDDYYKRYCKREGLGLIKGYSALVHYNRDNPKHLENINKVSKMTNRVILGISDKGGAVISDNSSIVTLGYVSMSINLGDRSYKYTRKG